MRTFATGFPERFRGDRAASILRTSGAKRNEINALKIFDPIWPSVLETPPYFFSPRRGGGRPAGDLDVRWGRSSGACPSAGCAGPVGAAREDGGSGWTFGFPPGRREHPLGAERRTPQARAEIARAVRTGFVAPPPAGGLHRSGLKIRDPTAFVHRPRGAPVTCRNGTLQSTIPGMARTLRRLPKPAGPNRREGAPVCP